MSYDSYIDNLISQTKDDSGTTHCDKACIIGLDDGHPWTSRQHPNALKLTSHEAQTIARCFKRKNFTQFMTNGVFAEETCYRFPREEDGKSGKFIIARKRRFGAVAIQATNTAVVVAHCPDGGKLRFTRKGLRVITKELESIGSLEDL